MLTASQGASGSTPFEFHRQARMEEKTISRCHMSPLPFPNWMPPPPPPATALGVALMS